MRVTGWSKLFLDYIDGRGGQSLHVLSELELVEAVALAGRSVSGNYRTIIAHAMRCIGWKLRSVSRTYVRKAPIAAGAR